MTNSTPSKQDANSYQVGGTHYRASIQHWDFVAQLELDYFQGVATKYIARWRNKNGLEDLKKAAHYVTKRIELTAFLPMPVTSFSTNPQASMFIRDFCRANSLTADESELVSLIAEGRLPAALEKLAVFVGKVEVDHNGATK